MAAARLVFRMPSLPDIFAPLRDARWPAGAFVAEFGEEEPFVQALRRLRELGYTEIETYSAYPVERAEPLLADHPSPLPVLVFLAGVSGGCLGYWIQWYASVVSYQLNIGGRPAHAVPAFFIPTFEGTVLAASCAAFVGLLALLRLPRPWHPLFEVEDIDRASVDRYFIAISVSDPRLDLELTPRDLATLGAVRISEAPATQ